MERARTRYRKTNNPSLCGMHTTFACIYFSCDSPIKTHNNNVTVNFFRRQMTYTDNPIYANSFTIIHDNVIVYHFFFLSFFLLFSFFLPFFSLCLAGLSLVLLSFSLSLNWFCRSIMCIAMLFISAYWFSTKKKLHSNWFVCVSCKLLVQVFFRAIFRRNTSYPIVSIESTTEQSDWICVNWLKFRQNTTLEPTKIIFTSELKRRVICFTSQFLLKDPFLLLLFKYRTN